jgi:RHS repeat-associated protein
LSDTSTIGGVTTTRSYCYSGDDRLAAGAGTPFGAATLVFDDRGNTTTEGAAQFTYNAIDQAMSIATPSTWASVVRDPQGRVSDRCSNTACNSYGYSSPADSMNWAELSPTTFQRFIALPGGVVVTTETGTPYFKVWAIPNLHGDVMVTTDNTATVTTGPHRYDPYGKPITTAPSQTVTDSVSYGWLGQHQPLTEDQTGHIWMGARVYNPTTGRFLQVDPVEQGTPNNYVYPTDPINQSDLDGRRVDAVDDTGDCLTDTTLECLKNIVGSVPLWNLKIFIEWSKTATYASLDYTNDGCSGGPFGATPPNDDACLRHDFLYRNWGYLDSHRSVAKGIADTTFKDDLLDTCRRNGGFACTWRANRSYDAVKRFGRPNQKKPMVR